MLQEKYYLSDCQSLLLLLLFSWQLLRSSKQARMLKPNQLTSKRSRKELQLFFTRACRAASSRIIIIRIESRQASNSSSSSTNQRFCLSVCLQPKDKTGSSTGIEMKQQQQSYSECIAAAAARGISSIQFSLVCQAHVRMYEYLCKQHGEKKGSRRTYVGYTYTTNRTYEDNYKIRAGRGRIIRRNSNTPFRIPLRCNDEIWKLVFLTSLVVRIYWNSLQYSGFAL